MQKFPLWQHLLSYLVPIRLKTVQSELSGELQINLYRGKKVLDTREVNYSFGALHTVMEKGIAKALKIQPAPGSVLLLGYGGGSAAAILREYVPDIAITAVELDATIIRLAREDFFSENINLIHADALKYIQDPHAFDLIVCDLFIGKNMPAEYASDIFFKQLRQNLSLAGVVVLNSISNRSKARELHGRFSHTFPKTMMVRIFDDNYVLFGWDPAGS